MTASPSYIDRPDYTDPRNPARFDLPLAARSILSSYVVAQAWLDRIGGALSVQCHPWPCETRKATRATPD